MGREGSETVLDMGERRSMIINPSTIMNLPEFPESAAILLVVAILSVRMNQFFDTTNFMYCNEEVLKDQIEVGHLLVGE